MILLITDRPERFSGLSSAITLKSLRLVRPEAALIRQILERREEEPEAVLCDLGAAGAKQSGAASDVQALRRCFGDLVPFVLVYESGDSVAAAESPGVARAESTNFGVAEIVALADQGFAHFRSIDDLFGAGVDSYLYSLIQQYESRQIIQGVRSFFIDQVVRDELIRTHGLLDALESGVMLVTPAFKNQDFLIHNVNDMLEILFETDLRSFENRTLSELLRSPEVREEVREAFRVDLNSVFGGKGPASSFENQARRSMLLSLGPEAYVERVISPFYQPDGALAGYVLLFQDMTFEVERGLIDRVTGLVGRDQLERALARRIRRMERFAKTRCGELGAILVKIRGLDSGDGFGDRAGSEALEYVLRKAGQGLKYSVRNAGVVSRVGRSEFLVAVPGLPLERVCEASRTILARMREIHIQAFGPLEVNAGVVHQALPSEFSAESGAGESELRTIQHELAARLDEARRALHRAADSGPNRAILYTRSGGYTEV
ncbi:MAG: PAS domain-containing protein [bacterium]|nr:PAS domain-containing protein [bacterium]